MMTSKVMKKIKGEGYEKDSEKIQRYKELKITRCQIGIKPKMRK